MAGGGRGEGGNTARLDELDELQLEQYVSYAAQAIETWETFVGNPGQMVMVRKHIIPAVLVHVKQAEQQWPINKGAPDYMAAVHNSLSDVVDSRTREMMKSGKPIGDYRSQSGGYKGKKFGKTIGGVDPQLPYRAFGDTLNDSYQDLLKNWLEARSLYEEHQFLGGAGPHSTSSVWR